jgi:glycosyltransferase involved in cell wall biosynthesis
VRIDQWVPALHRGDATGDSVHLMRDAFRRWGHESDVYALTLDPDLEGEGIPFHRWRPGGPEDVVLMHFALPSDLSAAFLKLRSRRVLVYHNMTPPDFFTGWDDELERIIRAGLAEIPLLAKACDLALGDSEWNRRELEAFGAARSGVLPIYMNFDRYREEPNPVRRRLYEDGRTNLLFVGRVAQNKRPDDLIRLASYWKRFISPDVRLLLVGLHPRRTTGHGIPLRRHYLDALVAFAYEEGLTPEEVVFTGHVEHDDLLACYAAADLFVSMSEHEGFGVPFLEAMLMRVPVLARDAAAVGMTLGGAGLAFRGGTVAEVAEAGRLVLEDAGLRERILAAQDERVKAFAPERVEAELRRYVESLPR